ncbi:MAG: hypothetical protein DRR19_02280 [Candidatus Parabeggiatoa sp. nov. 1]|nr:MAG: hypothetical protein DRR19_02280 [Gammaproteobacteria bacterium]
MVEWLCGNAADCDSSLILDVIRPNNKDYKQGFNQYGLDHQIYWRLMPTDTGVLSLFIINPCRYDFLIQFLIAHPYELLLRIKWLSVLCGNTADCDYYS